MTTRPSEPVSFYRADGSLARATRQTATETPRYDTFPFIARPVEGLVPDNRFGTWWMQTRGNHDWDTG